MKLFIIRHADPDYPNHTITASGHREAEALAHRMAGEKLDRIYSSPLGRALHTMNYTAELVGLTPVVEDWTCEISGCSIDVEANEWGRMAAWNLPGEMIRAGDPLPGHDTWQTLPYLGEARFKEVYDNLRNCSDAFLARHGYAREGGRYRCVDPCDERIAVFCHGGFGLTWIAQLLEIPLALAWSGFWLAPSSVTTILFEQRSAEWAVPRCLALGDTSHLYASGLPVQPRGILATNWP